MNYLVGLLVVVWYIVRSNASGSPDPHSHYVENTDPCNSGCQYYEQQCPILTFAPTGPGYDCNRGYCRLNLLGKCIRVERNTVYVENTDACGSLCKYASGCPIRTFAPTPPGFDCLKGYCRRESNGKCIRTMCYV